MPTVCCYASLQIPTDFRLDVGTWLLLCKGAVSRLGSCSLFAINWHDACGEQGGEHHAGHPALEQIENLLQTLNAALEQPK